MQTHNIGVAPNGPVLSNFTYIWSSARSHSNPQTYASSQTDRYLQPYIHKYPGHCGPCWGGHAKVIARVREKDVYLACTFE